MSIQTSPKVSYLSSVCSPSYLVLILYVVIGIGIYFNALDNPFQFDDELYVTSNLNIRTLRNIPYFFIKSKMIAANPNEAGHYRPLVVASYAINYSIGGLNPIGYHLVNLAFHIGSAFLIFLILQAMFDCTEKSEERSHKGKWSGRFLAPLAGGLIFLVHPFNSEAVNYVTARSSVLSGFFYLLAFWVWVKYRQVTGSSKQAAGLYIASLLAFVAGMLCKEVVITLPIVLWLYDLYLKPIPQSAIRNPHFLNWRTYVPYLPFILVVVIPYLFIRLFSFGNVLPHFQRDIWTQFYTELPVLIKQWQMFIFPSGLSLVHDIEINHRITPLVLSSMILTLLYIVLAVFLFRIKDGYWRVLSFFMFWFFIVLLPTTIFPLNAIFQENRGYLAMVSFSVFLASVFKKLDNTINRKIMTSVAAVLIMLYSTLVIERNMVWGDGVGFWNDVIKKAPNSVLSYQGLTGAYVRQGDIFLSIASSKKGLTIEPNNFYLLVYLAQGYEYVNKTDEAIQTFRKALEMQPWFGNVWNEIGTLYMKKGDLKRAEICFREGMKVWGDFPPLYYNLGRIFVERGEVAESADLFKRAVRLDPSFIQARYALGEALDKLGRSGEAAVQYKEIMRLASGDASPAPVMIEQDKEVREIMNKVRQRNSGSN